MGLTTSQYAQVCRNLGLNPIAGIQAAEGVKPSKFRNVPTTVNGIRFASKAEARAYQTLMIAAGHGLVSDLILQPRYLLQAKFTDGQGTKHRAVVYVGDFEFLRDGQRVCVDVKGREAPGFRAKWKLAIHQYPEVSFELWK